MGGPAPQPRLPRAPAHRLDSQSLHGADRQAHRAQTGRSASSHTPQNSRRRDHRAHPFAKNAKEWGTQVVGSASDGQRMGHPPSSRCQRGLVWLPVRPDTPGPPGGRGVRRSMRTCGQTGRSPICFRALEKRKAQARACAFFSLSIQNSKLERVKRQSFWIYLDHGISGMRRKARVEGLDKIFEFPAIRAGKRDICSIP